MPRASNRGQKDLATVNHPLHHAIEAFRLQKKADPLRQPAPVATGRSGERIHSLQDPA